MTRHTQGELIAWAKHRLEVDAAVRKAAEALVDALDACKPQIESAALLAHIHGFKASADSPTFHVELAALRALLKGEA